MNHVTIDRQDGSDRAAREMVEAFPLPSLLLDLDGTILVQNGAAREAMGAPAGGPGGIETLVASPGATLAADLALAAGASSWTPLRLVPLAGRQAGESAAFRARGLKGGDGVLRVMLVSDESVERNFARHSEQVTELNEQLARLRQTETLLREAVERGERLHRELIHRVKNNLAVLSAVVRGRARAARTEETSTTLRDVAARIQALATVHEVLDRKKRVESVCSVDLFDLLLDQLQAGLCPPGVALERDIARCAFPVQEAQALSLLLNELVTNCFKHAFADRDGGRVRVRLEQAQGRARLTVSDDGGGMSEESRKANTGSEVILALSQQLGADLDCHTGAGGTTWTLSFPIGACPAV